MRTNRIVPVLIAIVVLAATAAAQTAPPAQAKDKKPVDTAKLFAEIAGTYSYTFDGQDLVVSYWVESGKLYAAPQGQEAEYAEVLLKDAEALKFEATPPNGQLYEIEFSRAEDKKITKSVIRTQGIEVPGIRIK